jgi:5-methylcytosine-specific restriction endonuclease McrA
VSKPLSVKDRVRAYFIEHKGKVVTSRDLQAVAAPASEWARRVRELRDEEGWPIETHHDSTELKPGEYRLVSDPPTGYDVRFKREISAKLRAEVLDRDGMTCQMCGLTPGDIDPMTARKVRLHVGHVKDKSLGGRDELSNLRTLCSSCNQGAKNVTAEKPQAIWLLSQIRRSGVDEQRAVFEWLLKKFGDSPD